MLRTTVRWLSLLTWLGGLGGTLALYLHVAFANRYTVADLVSLANLPGHIFVGLWVTWPYLLMAVLVRAMQTRMAVAFTFLLGMGPFVLVVLDFLHGYLHQFCFPPPPGYHGPTNCSGPIVDLLLPFCVAIIIVFWTGVSLLVGTIWNRFFAPKEIKGPKKEINGTA